MSFAIILACGRLYSLASSVRFMMSGRTLAVSLASAAEYSSCTSSAEAIATEAALRGREGVLGGPPGRAGMDRRHWEVIRSFAEVVE